MMNINIIILPINIFIIIVQFSEHILGNNTIKVTRVNMHENISIVVPNEKTILIDGDNRTCLKIPLNFKMQIEIFSEKPFMLENINMLFLYDNLYDTILATWTLYDSKPYICSEYINKYS